MIYRTIKELHAEKDYSIKDLCKLGHVSRAGYYKWLKPQSSEYEQKTKTIATMIKEIHYEDPSKGYRRIKDELMIKNNIYLNDKTVLRFCREMQIKSTIKYRPYGCTINAPNPQYIAENLLKREFHADQPNQKWLTDVTEFKYYVNGEKHKVYLSAILDLFDRRIVAYVIRDRNDNPLVFDTFDQAVEKYPDAHPLFHSDRGFQYTNRHFHDKLEQAGMIHSMSRVGKCIDNGPMEGFWGMLKRERYYGHKFTDRSRLVSMIEEYIDYYNNKRCQRNLGLLTPMQKYNNYILTAQNRCQ